MQTLPQNNSPTEGDNVLANEIDRFPDNVWSCEKKLVQISYKQRTDAAERKRRERERKKCDPVKYAAMKADDVERKRREREIKMSDPITYAAT